MYLKKCKTLNYEEQEGKKKDEEEKENGMGKYIMISTSSRQLKLDESHELNMILIFQEFILDLFIMLLICQYNL